MPLGGGNLRVLVDTLVRTFSRSLRDGEMNGCMNAGEFKFSFEGYPANLRLKYGKRHACP